jgi:hypothetical protein
MNNPLNPNPLYIPPAYDPLFTPKEPEHYIMTAGTVYPTSINIPVGEGWLKIYRDGRVDIPEGATLTESASAFFSALRTMGMTFCNEESAALVQKLRARITELEAARRF